MKNIIKEWLHSIEKEGPLPASCKAIYIGLFEGEKEYQIYFIGSCKFDSENEDWACISDGDYIPKNKYLSSGVPTSSDWAEFDNQVVSIIKDLKSSGDTILNTVKNIGVGFDSGNISII